MLDIPISWERVKEKIIKDKGLVVVLGLPNTGKSSFVLYLSQESLKNNLKLGLINSDLGQSDFGLPTTVSLSIPQGIFYSYEELIITDWYFVGSTSPMDHLLPLIVGVKKLVEKAKNLGCEIIIVNTCGLLLGRLGKVLKYYKLSLLQPDHIVLIRKEMELESFLKIFQRLTPNFYVIPQSNMARERLWEERKIFRETKFSNYFSKGISIETPFSLLFSINKFIDKSKLEIFHNRLVALMGEKEELLALGILEKIDNVKNILRIFTPYREIEKIKRIELGDIYLTKKGEELKKTAPHL
jgi:polynucleotide 5'-hydroxyl-kinase GRC3/NOL9